MFRFYCRGENDTTAYKESLKSALNDALLYFLSEYLTKIEPELYLKQIQLKRKPASFRVSNSEITNVHDCMITDAVESEKLKRNRKRHKSMGYEKFTSGESTKVSSSFEGNTLDSASGCGGGEMVLRMNKSARETKLGKLLTLHKIADENELALFVANNFANNLFDHRDYEDTIEYFRESIKSFDYNRILNNLASQPLNSLAYLSFSGIGDYEGSSDDDTDELSSSVSSASSVGSRKNEPRLG